MIAQTPPADDEFGDVVTIYEVFDIATGGIESRSMSLAGCEGWVEAAGKLGRKCEVRERQAVLCSLKAGKGGAA